MLCTSCSKLSMMHVSRKCIKCQGQILNNISCICENCSNSEKLCSVCLKKIYLEKHIGYNKVFNGGCRSCGK